MSKKTEVTLEESKAKVLMRLRGYKIQKRKEYKNGFGFIVKTPKGKAMTYTIPTSGTVGVAYINGLVKILEDEKIETGVVVTSGRYTQAAKKKALANNIELIPRISISTNTSTTTGMRRSSDPSSASTSRRGVRSSWTSCG